MIINLTQHAATADQIAAGVVDLQEFDHKTLVNALTFTQIPTVQEMKGRAETITLFCVLQGADKAMIGGAPFLMPFLERSLAETGIKAYYAFSERVVEESAQPDGSVKKTAVFKHVGFVESYFNLEI